MRFFLTNITVTSQTSSSRIKHLSLDYVTVYYKIKSRSKHDTTIRNNNNQQTTTMNVYKNKPWSGKGGDCQSDDSREILIFHNM